MSIHHANLLAVSLVAAAAGFAPAQSEGPAFEVASVKPNLSGSRLSFGPGFQGRTLHAENITMMAQFHSAYNVQMPQIIGADYIDVGRALPSGALASISMRAKESTIATQTIASVDIIKRCKRNPSFPCRRPRFTF